MAQKTEKSEAMYRFHFQSKNAKEADSMIKLCHEAHRVFLF
jgi:hypothetical protein